MIPAVTTAAAVTVTAITVTTMIIITRTITAMAGGREENAIDRRLELER